MLKRIIFYLCIGVVLTMIPLYYMNNVLFSSATPTTANEENVSYKIKGSLSQTAACADFLYDHNHVSYIENGTMYIKDLKTDEVVKQLQEANPIIYALPLDDRNIILYFTYDQSKIDIKTYNFDKDEKTDHRSIDIKNVSRIKHVKWSSLTNLIYIDVEINLNGSKSDKIYKVDIMKDLFLFANNSNVIAMELLPDKDLLIYQDELGNITIRGQYFHYNSYTKFKLVGIDSSGTVYLSPVNNPLEVIMLKDDTVLGTKQIADISYTAAMSRDNHVYLIYKTHILDLVSGSDYEIDDDIKVLDVYNNNIFYETTDRKLKAKEL